MPAWNTSPQYQNGWTLKQVAEMSLHLQVTVYAKINISPHSHIPHRLTTKHPMAYHLAIDPSNMDRNP